LKDLLKRCVLSPVGTDDVKTSMAPSNRAPAFGVRREVKRHAALALCPRKQPLSIWPVLVISRTTIARKFQQNSFDINGLSWLYRRVDLRGSAPGGCPFAPACFRTSRLPPSTNEVRLSHRCNTQRVQSAKTRTTAHQGCALFPPIPVARRACESATPARIVSSTSN
jgi:hypothetical protein